jgi:putative ABC transport system permease protein
LLKNYFKTAIRSIRKSWLYSLLSVIGLAIGTGGFIVLMNYVDFEKNYDSFQKDKDNIYRVESYFSKNGSVSDSWVTSSFGYAAAMKSEFPQIKEITRIDNFDCERIVRFRKNIYREPRVVIADSNFFSFFSYKLLIGDPETALKEPNSIVLSVSAAKKYFGNESAVGKVLEVTTQKAAYHCQVTGVFNDFPAQSHLHLDLMISYSTTPPWERNTWYMHEAYTYVKVNSINDALAVEKGFPQLAEKYKTEPALKDKTWGVYLVPLANIHLNAYKPYEREAKGNRRTIDFIFIIAIIILFIGWINFINTLVSKSMERAGEISVRKIAGASGKDLTRQFVVESFLINLSALFLFFIFMTAFIPLIQKMYDENIFYHFWQRSIVWKLIAFTFFIGIIISSFVPLLILRNVDTAAVLKNNLSFRGGMGEIPRQLLIVFQYFAAMVLIVTTITVHRQLTYMSSMDLGFGIKETFVFKAPAKTDNFNTKLENLIQSLKKFNDVESVTASSSIPGKSDAFVMSNERDSDPEKATRLCDMIRIDPDFIPAFKLHLVKGRNFSRERVSDSGDAIILTQQAMQLLGFKNEEEAINGAINLEGQGAKKFRVIGVVKDFHQLTPKEAFRPIILTMFNPWNALDMQFVSLKINEASAKEILEKTENQFKLLFPGSSFDSFFLNDYFNAQYHNDLKYGSIVSMFTWLAIIIVCLGILGVSSFMLIRRTKEIAIRKIIGAGALQIVGLLNENFLKSIGIAFLLAMPAAWYAMHEWLQNFSYRININCWSFLEAACITLVITLVTVSALAIKTITANPVRSLKTE